MPAIFKVVLSNPSAYATTVTLNWAPSTAAGVNPIETNDVASFEYESAPGVWTAVPASGQVSIAAGQTEVQVRVNPTPDSIYEQTEGFVVNLTAATTNAQSLVITTGQQAGTISDEAENTGDLPTLSIDDQTVDEGAGTISFTVTRTGPSELASSVTYTVTPGTAETPEDYAAGANALSGTVSFAAGETSKTITLSVVQDERFERYQENFEVNLSAPVGATISKGRGVGSIIDDDTPVLALTGPSTVTEGEATTSYAVTLDSTAGVGLSWGSRLSFTLDSAGDTATEGTDYTALMVNALQPGANVFLVGTPTVDANALASAAKRSMIASCCHRSIARCRAAVPSALRRSASAASAATAAASASASPGGVSTPQPSTSS